MTPPDVNDTPADAADVVLEVAGLRAAYGHVPVLHGIDFRLRAGEAVGIVGHNGVGKTTFMKALIGLVPATAGRIVVDGLDVTRAPAHERSRLTTTAPRPCGETQRSTWNEDSVVTLSTVPEDRKSTRLNSSHL